MQINFLYHILISGCIFYLLATGATMYLKLRGSLDFSYLGIVIFGSYASVLTHLHWGRGILASLVFACSISLVFTFFVLYLSSRLQGLYFTIGTLTLYMLFYQLAYNLDGITGGAFGLTGMTRALVGGIEISGLLPYVWFAGIGVGIVAACLLYFKRTYIYTILQSRGERELVVRSLGIQIIWYKLLMVFITTCLAVFGGTMYSFYYAFIDPHSFWLPMLVLILVIVFGSYKFNEIGTFIFALGAVAIYEGLRFFKFVDPSQVGYVREIIFAFIILGTSIRVFRTTSFGRQT